MKDKILNFLFWLCFVALLWAIFYICTVQDTDAAETQWDYTQYIPQQVVEAHKKPKPDVPEPASVVLLGMGSLTLLYRRKR